MCFRCFPWLSFLSPLWGHCRARPCSWSRGALGAPAGPAAGHWPSRPLCSCPVQTYPAPLGLAFSQLPGRPVVPVSRFLSPEWACGCRWTPLWPTAPRAALFKWLVACFSSRMKSMEWRKHPVGKNEKTISNSKRGQALCLLIMFLFTIVPFNKRSSNCKKWWWQSELSDWGFQGKIN